MRAAQADGAEAARRAARAFPAEHVSSCTVVSAYSPMGSELDPGPLIRRLQDAGARLALPVVIAKAAPLVFREAGDPALHEPDAAGIRAPPLSSPVLRPDLVLAPLLAFDASGWRLGYGGGYYDRTLAALRASGPVLVVGLAFALQEVEHVPHGPKDERLDAILTERGYRLLD